MTVIQIARAPAGWLGRTRARRAQRVSPLTTTAMLVLGPSALLLVGGLIMILSASWVSAYTQYGSSYLFFMRQLMWALGGLVAMYVASRLDYRAFRGIGYALLVISIVGLVLVLHPSFGTRVAGSQRWLAFGPLRFQPSELAKLALALVGADLCARKRGRLTTVKEVMLPFGTIALIVGGLVMMQPDLGTALIIAGIVLVTLFIAGVRLPVLGLMGVGGAGGALMLSLTSGYRKARLFSFLNPFADPLKTGYQAIQARIALGSGGLFGVGLGASRQKWMYIPNAHTDFIFAIIGEELGLLGAFMVIALFGMLAYAGIRAARRAPDAFGRIAAGAITAWIVGQSVVNMGAVTGLLPITGVPLPLVSFGGSSLLITLLAIGIMLNIGRQEAWPPQAPAVDTTSPSRTRAR
ncbi:MAG: putative lipid II flippase FtsW [Actinomycetota bacterium]